MSEKMGADQKTRMEKMRQGADEAKKAMPAAPPIAHALSEGSPADLKVYLRGNPAAQGPVAPRRFLRILGGDHPSLFTKGSGRLELAEAIAHPSNPLTARVFVNRLWKHHFGTGLVNTPGNFGKAGALPT
jgi:hypothetical protein